MIEGALILLSGLLLGRITLPKRKRGEPSPICGCKHHLSKHDPKTGACAEAHSSSTLTGYDTRSNPIYQIESYRCTCKHYVGPVPADMMLRSWNPKGIEQ